MEKAAGGGGEEKRGSRNILRATPRSMLSSEVPRVYIVAGRLLFLARRGAHADFGCICIGPREKEYV